MSTTVGVILSPTRQVLPLCVTIPPDVIPRSATVYRQIARTGGPKGR